MLWLLWLGCAGSEPLPTDPGTPVQDCETAQRGFPTDGARFVANRSRVHLGLHDLDITGTRGRRGSGSQLPLIPAREPSDAW